ncbi:hypothetical protein C8R44DRAFT_888360 [Mycena epipterygia]|nr:hypothetical protein C8R44DRAFT_888360 [Mycena epipterygia]
MWLTSTHRPFPPSPRLRTPSAHRLRLYPPSDEPGAFSTSCYVLPEQLHLTSAHSLAVIDACTPQFIADSALASTTHPHLLHPLAHHHRVRPPPLCQSHAMYTTGTDDVGVNWVGARPALGAEGTGAGKGVGTKGTKEGRRRMSLATPLCMDQDRAPICADWHDVSVRADWHNISVCGRDNHSLPIHPPRVLVLSLPPSSTATFFLHPPPRAFDTPHKTSNASISAHSPRASVSSPPRLLLPSFLPGPPLRVLHTPTRRAVLPPALRHLSPVRRYRTQHECARKGSRNGQPGTSSTSTVGSSTISRCGAPTTVSAHDACLCGQHPQICWPQCSSYCMQP